MLPSLSSPRAAMLAGFGAFGASTGAWSGSIPTVMRNAGVDEYRFGIMATVATAATILAMVLGGRLARHLPVRHLLLAFMPMVGLAAGLFLLSASPWGLAAAFVVFGFAYGMGDLFINTEASSIEHDEKRPIFTGFHAAGSTMAAVFAILSSLTSVLLGTWATVLTVAVVYAAAFALIYRHVPLRPLPAAMPQGHAPLNRGLLSVLGLALGLVIAAETASLIWSAKLLQDLSPRLAAVAGAGAAFYCFCAAVIRMKGDALRARFGEKPVMVASLVLSVVSFAALGLNLSFTGNVIAFAGVVWVSPCSAPASMRWPQARPPPTGRAPWALFPVSPGRPAFSRPMPSVWLPRGPPSPVPMAFPPWWWRSPSASSSCCRRDSKTICCSPSLCQGGGFDPPRRKPPSSAMRCGRSRRVAQSE